MSEDCIAIVLMVVHAVFVVAIVLWFKRTDTAAVDRIRNRDER